MFSARAGSALGRAIRRLCPQLVAITGIAGIDRIRGRDDLALPAEAVLDESAHLVTSHLILSGLGFRKRTAFWWSAAAASVLIDLDHIPELLGYRALSHGAPRPYPHSLTMVGLPALLSLRLTGTGRDVARGVAAGVALHLVRDMATGGVPLFWPATRRGARLPYVLYHAALALTAIRRPRSPAPAVGDGEGIHIPSDC